MPRAATMTRSLLIPQRTFAQVSTGEWLPNEIDWDTITPTPCRSFPVTQQSITSIWGESIRADIGLWILPDVTLPPEVLTTDSGAQTPVKVDGVPYMVSAVKDLANFGKLKAVALRRFGHG